MVVILLNAVCIGIARRSETCLWLSGGLLCFALFSGCRLLCQPLQAGKALRGSPPQQMEICTAEVPTGRGKLLLKPCRSCFRSQNIAVLA